MPNCSLCSETGLVLYHEDNKRQYFQCANCQLVSVPEKYHLSPAAEKAEYDKHQNDPGDIGYRRFLSRAVEPLFNRLPAGAVGLDFGCGPGPTISLMAKEQGIQMADYDPYYQNDPELLAKKYDFITMTEVIEHLAEPAKVLKSIDNMLVPSGILAIMTKRVISKEAFANWHYKNDPTHIAFYSDKTFNWIAQKINWQLEIIDKDVVFFTKE